MPLDATAAGLLLIGAGSLLAALPRLIRPDRPKLGLEWESLARPIERLHFSSESVGLVFVAVGSAVVAITALHPWWFVLIVLVAACLGVWCVAAWKLRQLWMMRAVQTTEYVPTRRHAIAVEDLPVLARRDARWSACLAKPFSSAVPWPPAADLEADTGTRLEPGHIAALHRNDARLEDAQIPSEIRFDVQNLRAQGFTVSVVGDAVIAKVPDGQTAQISRSRVASHSVGSGLHIQLWLDELQKIGARIQTGPQGKRYVAPDVGSS
jgi:hypothetical protein